MGAFSARFLAQYRDSFPHYAKATRSLAAFCLECVYVSLYLDSTQHSVTHIADTPLTKRVSLYLDSTQHSVTHIPDTPLTKRVSLYLDSTQHSVSHIADTPLTKRVSLYLDSTQHSVTHIADASLTPLLLCTKRNIMSWKTLNLYASSNIRSFSCSTVQDLS